MNRPLRSLKAGFTLIEMMVIAPIVILLIGGFIALIVNLTGEVMSSRGANVLTYNVQDALNRIEEDVKLSTTFLAVNNIDVSITTGTKQGYGGTTTAGSGTNFTNVNKTSSGGSPASIILNTLATNANPLSNAAGLVYLKDQPNPCSSLSEYSKNRPMTTNVIYFVDSSNTLWRRVIMPSNYADASIRCGNAPWQIPTCINGYSASSLPFCKANDEKLIEGVAPSDFTFQYYTSASSVIANTTAVNAGTTDDARNTALLSTPTIEVKITAKQTIAGRDITRSASLRATRLDSNATSIAKDAPVTSAPAAPAATGVISDGHIVTFTWPRVANATAYSIDYQIKANGAICDAATSGTWTTGNANLGNNARTYTITTGNHTDRICARVRANNSVGWSSYTVSNTVIPLWMPLQLQGDWTDYANGYSTAAYTKTKSGLVMLKGLVKKPTAATSGEVIARLPADYRPAEGALLFGTSTASNTWGRVDVWPGGEVQMATGSNGWFSLETVRFMSSTASYTRTAPTFANGWTNYAPASWARASYVQDSTGRVVIQGLVAGGPMTDGTTIFNLPTALAPPQYLHIASHASGNGFSAIGVNTTPTVHPKGVGTNGYLSLNANYMPASASVTWSNMTLQNSWIAYPGYATPQYTKASDGVVHLKGLLRAGTTGDGTIVTNLPAGYRPKERILFTSASASGVAGYVRVDIQTTGDVSIHAIAGNGWLSFDGISFYPEQ